MSRINFLEMCLQVSVLRVFIVCYGIAKCIREITRGSVMCRYLTANDLIYDRMNTLYNISVFEQSFFATDTFTLSQNHFYFTLDGSLE